MVKVSVKNNSEINVSVKQVQNVNVCTEFVPAHSPSGINLNIGLGLKYNQEGALVVDTANEVQVENLKPVTSAAVYTEIGNINALLETI